MNRYESYQDSGIPWLGEVPEHWTLGNLMYFISCSSGDALPSVLIHKNESNDINIPVIGGNGLFGYIDNSNFTENCLAIGRVGALCGNVHYINYPSWINDNALIVKLRTDKIYLTFLDYFFQSRNLNELASKTAQPLLTGTQVKKEKIAIPPLPEQTAIADYLDNKLGEIDALISKQQSLLEKLAEQRTATITQAVTKGLNPDVPMKDSGVAWLGEVPSHWRVLSLKFICDVRDGTHDTPQYVYADEQAYPLITSKDINFGYINFDNTKFISEEDYLAISKRSNVTRGDLIMPMIGTVGGCVLVETDKKFAIKNVSLFKFANNFNSKWLKYFLDSEIVRIQFDLKKSGGVQDFVSLGTLRNLTVFNPQLTEQTAIANYLDEQTAHIDRLSDTVRQTIDRLQEYRSTLITQVVTGKIKVV